MQGSSPLEMLTRVFLAVSLVNLAWQLGPRQLRSKTRSELAEPTPGLEALRPLSRVLFGALCLGLSLLVPGRATRFASTLRPLGGMLFGAWLGFTLCQLTVGGMLRRGVLRTTDGPEMRQTLRRRSGEGGVEQQK